MPIFGPDVRAYSGALIGLREVEHRGNLFFTHPALFTETRECLVRLMQQLPSFFLARPADGYIEPKQVSVLFNRDNVLSSDMPGELAPHLSYTDMLNRHESPPFCVYNAYALFQPIIDVKLRG
jgi:hypothetical protein